MVSRWLGLLAPAVGLLTIAALVFAYPPFVAAVMALPTFVITTWAAGQVLGAAMVKAGSVGSQEVRA